MPDFGQLAWALPVLLAAYFIRGLTGFGSGLIAVPLLALKWPLTFVVPLILLTDFTASLILGGLHFDKVAWPELRRLLPAGFIGVLAGAYLLVSLPREPMLMALGTLIILFALRNLSVSNESPRRVSPLWAWPAALTGGTVGAMFGTGGPPYVMYLSHRLTDKGQLRATFSGLFFIEGLARIVTFAAGGILLHAELFYAYAAAVPVTLGALWVGSHAHSRLSNGQMLRLISLILIGSGLALWIKVL